jgi:hypothetical protein
MRCRQSGLRAIRNQQRNGIGHNLDADRQFTQQLSISFN